MTSVRLKTALSRVNESSTPCSTASFLPAYPVFILSFLQSIESSRPMDNIGSYGYHYEAFITTALSRHAEEISLDIKYQFLSELAYRFFAAETPEIDQLSLDVFYTRYCEKYGISPDWRALLASLLNSRLLELYEGAYRFKYPYACTLLRRSLLQRQHRSRGDKGASGGLVRTSMLSRTQTFGSFSLTFLRASSDRRHHRTGCYDLPKLRGHYLGG